MDGRDAPPLSRPRSRSQSADGRPLHTVTERFGFRTIEVRERDGVYLNGTKIVLKGVNRHAFWPETGRTVSREQSYADVRLIKEANLNAVRMSHYPPDEHFLEACDELGLYVLDELAGWQKSYGDGRRRAARRRADPPRRQPPEHPVLGQRQRGRLEREERRRVREVGSRRAARCCIRGRCTTASTPITTSATTAPSSSAPGPQIFMPTEFLHGLYDGGIGAGLRDYWDVMGKSPTVAGGFLWVWADEGVVRTDQNGRIDTAGNQAPDGMVGPHREKEGSYFAVKEIWSPVQVALPADAAGRAAAATGTGPSASPTATTSRSLERCRFEWQLLRFASPGAGRRRREPSWPRGPLQGPALAAAQVGHAVAGAARSRGAGRTSCR